MSTAKFDTLQNAAGTVSVPVNTVVNGSAKAWVNFNGTGTVAIRAAFNVSSITDNGVGDYTVNFIAAMTDANYAYAAAGQIDTSNSDGNRVTVSPRRISGGIAVGSIRVVAGATQLATTLDVEQVTVTIFR